MSIQVRNIILVCLGLMLCPVANAAERTDVADAVDTVQIGNYSRDDVFDMYFNVDVAYNRASGRISREPINPTGQCSEQTPTLCQPVDELSWSQASTTMNIAAEVGLFRDISLTLKLPIILNRSLSFDYAEGVTAATSTIDPQSDDANQRIFAHDYTTGFSGVGSLELGARFSPLNGERSEADPTWVVNIAWSIPWTSTVYRPGTDASDDKPVGDGVHRLKFETILSKRVANFGLIGIDPDLYRRGYIDPYIGVGYTLPIPDSGDAERALIRTSSNSFGTRPPHQANLTAGFEVVAYEDVKMGQKFAIDLGMDAQYNSQGRDYTVLTGPLNELTFTQQFFELAGRITVIGHIAHYLRLKAGFSLGYRTDHFVTDENVGTDRDGDDQVVPNGQDELNPYFCGNSEDDLCTTQGISSYDQIGFRFRNEGQTQWSIFTSVVLTL